MKIISQKGLDKLRKKGWQLTPDSKKVINSDKMISMLTRLVQATEGVERALSADKGGGNEEYLAVIDKFTESLKALKIQASVPAQIQQTEVVKQETDDRGWKFIVKRNQEGFISEIEAVKN